jgi:DNA-binding NarL/FixJ family response regulator
VAQHPFPSVLSSSGYSARLPLSDSIVHLNNACGDILIRPRILLADDHPALLEAEIAVLSPFFDVVGTAVDGGELVSKAHSLRPDIIVTDISMPVLNGIDTAHKLRESGSTAIILFLTIHSEREFVDACMGAGALGYVQKHHMRHQLVPAIQAALAGKSYVSQHNDSTK